MRFRRLPHLVALLVLASAAPVSAWQTALTGSGRLAWVSARALATGPAGALFVVETEYAEGADCVATVVKSRADTGGVVWRQIVSDQIGCDVLKVAADVQGNVVVATAAVVVKLAGANGATLWGPATVRSATGTTLAIAALAPDASGDVVVAGARPELPEDGIHYDRELAVAKLASADGAVRWQADIDGIPASFDPRDPSKNLAAQDGALAVAIDATGDVIAAGYLGDAGSQKLAVVKLGGANGGEVWRYTAGGSWSSARAVAVDATGAVTVVGDTDGTAAVARLSGSGDVLWQQPLVCPLHGSVADVRLGPDGDAYVVGLESCGVSRTFAARLDRVDGLVRWLWLSPAQDAYETLALAGADPVLIGTRVDESTSAGRLSVVRLKGLSGDVLWTATRTGSRDYGDMGVAVAAVDDDVIAAGTLTTGFWGTFATVQRLTSPTGSVAWQTDASHVAPGFDTPAALALAATGQVVSVGALANVDTDLDFAIVGLGAADGAEAWRHEIDGAADSLGGADGATAVAADHAGGIIAAGSVNDAASSYAPTVVKFDAATGAESWRRSMVGLPAGVRGVAVDANDDVFVLGYGLTVLKLAGADGDEQWRRAVPAGPAGGRQPGAIVVDTAGDVVVAGSISDDGYTVNLLVVKIDGRTGVERWRYRAAGTVPPGTVANIASAVAVDAAGDVLVTGVVDNLASSEDLFAAKIDGATGVERWRYEYDGSAHYLDRGWSIGVDPAGDVIVSGTAREKTNAVGIVAMKLDRTTGAAIWRRAVAGPGTPADWKYGVPAGVSTIDGAGDVLVTGTTYDAATGFDFTIAKLAGKDGRERWRRRFDGSARQVSDGPGDPVIQDEYGVDIVTDGCGNVFAMGRVVNRESAADIAVVALDGATGRDLLRSCAAGTLGGCPPLPRPGCKKTVRPKSSTLLIKRSAATPKRNRLEWRWHQGEATTSADLGSPLGTRDYAVCLYDRSDAVPRLVLSTWIPGADTCNDRACWQSGRRGNRLAYLDNDGRREGVTYVKVDARPEGRSELALQAKGERLAVPPLPLAPPLLLQLNVESGACFEATFQAAGMSRADGTVLRARGGR